MTVTCHAVGCEREAVGQMRLGCVHEHIYRTAGCQPCIDGARAGLAHCRLCATGPDRHKCPVQLVRNR